MNIVGKGDNQENTKQNAGIYMRKQLPILIGVLLGLASILIIQIPNHIKPFTGLTIIGNQVGYMLGALIIAWESPPKWSKRFFASTLTMAVAILTYFFYLYLFNFSGDSFVKPFVQLFDSFVLWLAGGVVVSSLAATTVFIAKESKSKLLNYIVFAISYLGILGVIYFFNIRVMIDWYNSSIVGDSFPAWRFIGDIFAYANKDNPASTFQMWRFTGYVFEIIFAIILSTAVLLTGLKHYIREKLV